MHHHPIRRLFLGLAVILLGVHDAPGSTADDKPLVAQAEDDPALVGNAQFCCRFDVGRAWHGPEAALLKKVCQSHPIVPLWEGNGLEKTLGLQLTDLDRFVFFAEEIVHLERGAAIVTTLEPFNRDKVVTALVPNGKEVKINDRACIIGDKDGLAVVVRDKLSLVIASRAGIEALLTRKPIKPGELKEALIPGPKSLMAIRMQPGTLLPGVQNGGKEAEPFVPLFQARSWLLVAEETDESLLLSFRLTFADEANATKARPGLQALVAPLEWYLGMAENQFPEFRKREAGKYPGAVDLTERIIGTIQALRTALKDFQIEQAGPVVQANLRVKTKTPATTLLMIFNLLPRAANEP